MTKEPSDPFSDLRGILLSPPSYSTWGKLVRTLGKVDKNERDLAVSYVSQHLEAEADNWPESLRWISRNLDHPAAPLARHFLLPKMDSLANDFFQRDIFSNITMFSIVSGHGNLHPRAFQLLCRSTQLAQLHTLSLSTGQMELSQHIDILCNATFADNLRSLDLSHDHSIQIWSTETIKAIIQVGIWSQLHTFKANGMQIWDVELCDLLAHAPNAHLKHLELNNCQLDWLALERFLHASWIGQIEHLQLSFNTLDKEAIALLAETTHLTNLRYLDLRSNGNAIGSEFIKFDDEDVELMLASPLGQQLEGLWIDGMFSPECRKRLKAYNGQSPPPLHFAKGRSRRYIR